MKYLVIVFAFLCFNINAQESKDAVFPGGNSAMYQFLAENIKYPSYCGDSCLQGKVYVQFITEKDGSISNVKCIKSLGKVYDEDAMNCIKSMPKWTPAVYEGKPARDKYTIPFNFKIEEE